MSNILSRIHKGKFDRRLRSKMAIESAVEEINCPVSSALGFSEIPPLCIFRKRIHTIDVQFS